MEDGRPRPSRADEGFRPYVVCAESRRLELR